MKREEKIAGRERFIKPFPQILQCEEKATTTTQRSHKGEMPVLNSKDQFESAQSMQHRLFEEE